MEENTYTLVVNFRWRVGKDISLDLISIRHKISSQNLLKRDISSERREKSKSSSEKRTTKESA